MSRGKRPWALRLATRKSALALAQARLAAKRLSQIDPDVTVELIPLTTTGDHSGARGRLDEDKSRFVKELEEALLRADADLAVHSAKDLPGDLPPGLSIASVFERADPRDALVGARSVSALKPGSVVGTSSLRRRAQLLAVRDDLEVQDLSGNLDTRLEKVQGPSYDAVVVAYAGLNRLGASGGYPLAVSEMLPAAGQGCLVLEATDEDGEAQRLALQTSDPSADAQLRAERAVTRALGASCQTPVAAHATHTDNGLVLEVFVGRTDGSQWIRDRLAQDGAEPARLGELVAERLFAAGAGELLAQTATDAHELGRA